MSAHELIVDALEGFFYTDDEQLTEFHLYEHRMQDADGYLFLIRPRSAT